MLPAQQRTIVLFVNACARHALAQRVRVSGTRPQWLLCGWVEGQETVVGAAQRGTADPSVT